MTVETSENNTTKFFYDSKYSCLAAGIYKSDNIVHESSSGGAFTAIYEYAINLGYHIFGVKFSNDLKVMHAEAKSTKECEEFRKSKYIMSDINDCYIKISELLKNNEKVLFTGTPCQCLALILFLEAKRICKSNLITVDLVCHGAPNQDIFNSYILELEKKKKEKIFRYVFKQKNKINGKVNSRSAQIIYMSGKKEIVNYDNDPFLRGYYSRLFYRPSCNYCGFAQPNRVSDLTIGDAWGIQSEYKDWDPLKGVSLLIANTYQGKNILDKLGIKMDLRQVSLQWAIKNNSALIEPTKPHINREKFFKEWQEIGFYRAVYKCTNKSIFRRVGAKLYRILCGKR